MEDQQRNSSRERISLQANVQQSNRSCLPQESQRTDQAQQMMMQQQHQLPQHQQVQQQPIHSAPHINADILN